LSDDTDERQSTLTKRVSPARSKAAKKAARTRAENARLAHLWKHEQELWRSGYELIAGVDESGVGPLAGPVVAAAVILPRDFKAPGLWECKRLLADKRPQFWSVIVKCATAVGIGVVDVEELDRINIHQAALKAMRQAISCLPVNPDSALVDGFSVPGLEVFQRPIVDGDQYSISIAAASVVAKVTRDRIMERLDRLYPGYGFANHKGYGTREHRAALQRLGVCPIHRRSFAPIVQLIEGAPPEAGDGSTAAQARHDAWAPGREEAWAANAEEGETAAL
jgi:ribonuclease HII